MDSVRNTVITIQFRVSVEDYAHKLITTTITTCLLYTSDAADE